MEKLRQRPKDNFTWEAAWQQLYVLTEHWKSDLEFYRDDLKFLQHLIDKYFIWIAQKENLDEVREIASGLLETRGNCDVLLKRISKHLSHLANLIDDPFKYDSHQFRSEHEKLEDDIAVFVKTFRENRKETFAITEHVIEKEKLEHLLTS